MRRVAYGCAYVKTDDGNTLINDDISYEELDSGCLS